MTTKVLLIVGMGPNIGMSMARRFGQEGYRIGMIARGADKLARMADDLGREGIGASFEIADVMDRAALASAIGKLEARLGRIDVLEYSPLLDMAGLIDVLALDDNAALEQFEFQTLGAIASVQAVLPGMLAHGDGALLFTTGVSAYVPAPSHANGSLGVTALRHYAVTLNIALKPHGIYAGTISIARPYTGTEVADLFWDMAAKRDRVETILGEPRIMAAYEELVVMGLGDVYPARFTGDLPAPQNDRDRHLQLAAIYHVHANMKVRNAAQSEYDSDSELIVSRGGDPALAFYGADLDAVFPHPPLR